MEEEGFFTGAKVLDLSDGIMAFSMTLLIATIAIPDPAQTPIEGLSSALWELKPKFLVCIFSFIIIALYWSNHHRIFQEIKKFDTTTVWLNMLFLLSIVIMPFTAALFGEYEDQQLTMMLFAANMAIAGFILWGIWAHCTHKKHIDQGCKSELAHKRMITRLVSPSVFLLSIPLSYISFDLAVGSWLLIPVFLALFRKFVL